MAKFCTGCGSPIEEGLKFCSKCGAQVGATSGPGPAPAPQAATGPPSGPVPPGAAAPPKAGSPILKIVLIVLGIFAFVTVASLATCVYVGYRVKQTAEKTFKVDESGKSISITTPQGEIKLGERTGHEDEPIGGVPPYPGSTAVEGGGELSFGDKGGISGQEYDTSDPVDNVVAFYKEKFGSQLSVTETEGHFRLALVRGQEEGVTTIDVSRDEDTGKTKIFIAHMGK